MWVRRLLVAAVAAVLASCLVGVAAHASFDEEDVLYSPREVYGGNLDGWHVSITNHTGKRLVNKRCEAYVCASPIDPDVTNRDGRGEAVWYFRKIPKAVFMVYGVDGGPDRYLAVSTLGFGGNVVVECGIYREGSDGKRILQPGVDCAAKRESLSDLVEVTFS